ncbi:MAG TPA: hypothetical protein ENJ01_04400 [Gammaproteobacteria bacterium]|nr:hypothetical protein [Gammaproteobacteria bacterium]
MSCSYCKHRAPGKPRTGLFTAFAIGMLGLAVVMAIWGPVWLALTALLGAGVAWLAIATTPTEPSCRGRRSRSGRCPYCGRPLDLPSAYTT